MRATIAARERSAPAHVERAAGERVVPVVTVLAPAERARVDAAGEGLYHALHRESVDDALRDLRERRASAVLVSVTRCGGREAARVARVVREFPRVPAVALLTQLEAATPHAVLSLGRCGVERLVDVRSPQGWRELREVLARDRGDAFSRLALETLALDVAGAPPECHHFFALLFGPGTMPAPTVRALARGLGVVPSTLMSRFFRAGLPAPKRYLALARLVRAARLFENPGMSVASVANALEYSSPQSFGRHVRTLMRMTSVQFRERYDGEGMLRRFREELVLPYLAALRQFNPLHVPPGWLGGAARQREMRKAQAAGRRARD
ncbi:MAG TPA: helix-turn-helix domain-containing protein [Gemmatimonadales bacterium]